MHSFAPEIMLITILSLVILSDTLAERLKIPSVFLLLTGSYLVYTFRYTHSLLYPAYLYGRCATSALFRH